MRLESDTWMCWAASRVEYISIAATVVSSLPVSPRAMTRLSRQQHASADTSPPAPAAAAADFISDEQEDEASSSNS